MRQNKPRQPKLRRAEPWVGPLPASPGCDCQICRPGPFYDAEERRSIDTILAHGWQVVAVSDDGPCSCPEHRDSAPEPDPGPPFAYTVGLGHRCGHPELLMSGLRPALMHHALNKVAEQVMAGRRLAAGDVLEGVLRGVPVVLENLTAGAAAETVLWSGWFHRRAPEALVIVWPDPSGVFAWQPGAPDVLHEAQPQDWREPLVHSGGVAVDPDWVFPVPPDHHVLSCTHVVVDGDVVRFAGREPAVERGHEWTIHCGAGTHATRNLVPVHLAHLVRASPSLRRLGGLPPGATATRTDAYSDWETGDST